MAFVSGGCWQLSTVPATGNRSHAICAWKVLAIVNSACNRQSFWANEVTWGGGGVNTHGALSAFDVRFVENTANTGAGMEVILFWDVVLNDVEFVDNVAESYGGAIYGFVGRGDSTTDNRFNNVTFARNSAAEGAAIFNEYENVSLNVTNAVFWSNTGSATSSVYTVEGSNTSLQYSCFEEAEAQAGEGNLVMAPDSLAVIDLDGDGFEELLLTSGSPCIDAGSDTLAGDAGLATSQSAQWWYIRSTSDDCLPDLNTVDMGRHHALDICEVPLP